MRHEQWWRADKDRVNERVIAYVSEVERQQSYLFERFYKLGALYDPYYAYQTGWVSNEGARGRAGYLGPDADVSENVIASSVDTVTAIVAASEVRSRFMTDDADWSAQRNARHVEWYAEGLAKLLDFHGVATSAFRDAALKGTGVVKVYPDPLTDEIRVERVLIDDIVVDEGECRAGGEPRQMHQRVLVDREVLASSFPDFADVIESAQVPGVDTAAGRLWAAYRPIERNQVVVIESWHLPIGRAVDDSYKPGRHTIVVPGHDLADEEYHKTRFPFVRIVWSGRDSGWYGIGGAERIAGHQRRINKLNWQVDRQHDQLAVPTTYVRMADANLAVRTTNRLGSIAAYKADVPKTVIPPAVSPETYARQGAVRESAFEEFGVSRLAATAKKPSGLDSGIALREYRDMTTQRFAQQEKAFERFFLDLTWLALDVAKDLGARAPEIMTRTRFGRSKIPWSKISMLDLRVQIAAASTISRTPAGRMQMVLEWAQAGVVTQDEARRLLRHPDLERAMSLYTAALEDIERCIEEVLDGGWLVPEPYQHLRMGVWRFQAAYLKARGDGAPEEILELLRQWIVQAAHILAIQNAAEQQMAAGGEAAMPAEMMSAPAQGAPQAAFAPGARLGLRIGSGE